MSYKRTIENIAVILRAEAMRYRKIYDELAEKKDRMLKEAEAGYIGNVLKNKIEEINTEFEQEITNLRINATKSLDDLNELRESEISKVGAIDEKALSKVNALRGLPVTAEEIEALASDEHISTNYWAKKAVKKLAEDNNYKVENTGYGAELALKLSILDELSDQYNRILKNYPTGNGDEVEAINCKYVYLSDSVTNRAVLLYGGKIDYLSQRDRANKAWNNIRAKETDSDKALAIGNALRNSKTSENRNALIYKIVTDTEINDYALRLTGHYNELMEFRNNKLSNYKRATEAVEKIRMTNSKERIDMIIGEEEGNECFNEMFSSEMKHNEYLKELMRPTQPETTGAEAE